MSCRTFGPPVRIGDENLPERREDELLDDETETVIAFALRER